MSDDLTFGEWWRTVELLADRYEVSYLLSESPADHKDAFDDGDAPETHVGDLMLGAIDEC